MKNLMLLFGIFALTTACQETTDRSSDHGYAIYSEQSSATQTDYILLKFSTGKVEHFVFNIDSSGAPVLNEVSSTCVPYYSRENPLPEFYFYSGGNVTTTVQVLDDGSFYADKSVDPSIAALSGDIVQFEGIDQAGVDAIISSASQGTTIGRCTP